VILPDVNVLLSAFRADGERHGDCRAWLDGVVNSDSAFGLSPQVLSSVVRIVTHPGIYREPTSTSEAIEFCNVLLDQPHCQIIVPGPRHWGIFTKLCHRAHATGNLVPDAWFAALAIESGCEWITMDGDYARFEGLKARSPID
jgi:toxin-antitoxin system PIN domain toxin